MLLILISLVLCQLIFVQSGKISSGDVLKSYLQKTREFINQEIKKLGGVLSPSTGVYMYFLFIYNLQ